MSNLIKILVTFIIGVALGYFGYSFLNKEQPPIIIDNSYKLDSLNNIINKYQKNTDSLQIIIDSSNHKIIHIDKWYEKEIEYIKSADIDTDIEFFTKYLSESNN